MHKFTKANWVILILLCQPTAIKKSCTWDRQSTEIDNQQRSTIDWERQSTEIDNRLRSTIDWDWQYTEIDSHYHTFSTFQL